MAISSGIYPIFRQTQMDILIGNIDMIRRRWIRLDFGCSTFHGSSQLSTIIPHWGQRPWTDHWAGFYCSGRCFGIEFEWPCNRELWVAMWFPRSGWSCHSSGAVKGLGTLVLWMCYPVGPVVSTLQHGMTGESENPWKSARHLAFAMGAFAPITIPRNTTTIVIRRRSS